MKKILLVMMCFVAACSIQNGRLIELVNPFVGTDFHGHTYPGATLPFGAVQLSPDTRRGNWDACSGYHYSDSVILGFSHTHLSGTGCMDLADILFYPSAHELIPDGKKDWMKPLAFSHLYEDARPGYYTVYLPTENIRVELTATRYVGMHRYQFGEDGTGTIVIDLAHTLSDDEQINRSEVRQTAAEEVCGMRCTDGWVKNQHIFFVARFSQPLKSLAFMSDGSVYRDRKEMTGGKLQAIATFVVKSKIPLSVEVGLSLVSVENARENLERDINGMDFDAVMKKAEKTWVRALEDIIVEGGTQQERTNFYTALYHSKLVPNVVSDVNGEYRRHNMSIGTKEDGRKQYSTFSFWDTFRAWHPMMTLLDTIFVNDMVTSALDIYEMTGELPIWPLASGETGTMIGYHAVSVIADAWLKNIRGFDGQRALRFMVASAEKNGKGASDYIRQGFIPADVRNESIACLLEFAYDDWAIARMAENLGQREIAECFAVRSQSFANVFDGSTRFFRGKYSDGSWEVPFDPYAIGRSYTEATAWQYRFFVPHDMNGLIQLYGGRKVFLEDLDHLFTTTSDLVGSMIDVTGLIGQYAQGNEPSHHMAYLYNYVGEPWKTQQMVRRILKEMYQPTPKGICGNEDCGQMSAWYIMSSLGLYPVCPGTNEFALTSPLFSKVTLQLANGKRLVISANDPEKYVYIQKVFLNDVEIDRNFICYEELMQGGDLRFELSAEPNKERGISESAFPYSFSKGKQVSLPYIKQNLNLFDKHIAVALASATEGAEIRYTLDGSEPQDTSEVYCDSIMIDHSLIVKAKGFKTGYFPSRIGEFRATMAEYRPGVTVRNVCNGTEFQYYEGVFSQVKDLEQSLPLKQGQMSEPSITKSGRDDHFGYIWSGWIYAPERGVYEFLMKSDDGSVLKIGEQEVVKNDGSHSAVSATGRIALDKGYHPYTLFYFEDYGGQEFEWMWKTPSMKKMEQISVSSLFRAL